MKKEETPLGVTFTGNITVNGPMFDIHNNEHVYIGKPAEEPASKENVGAKESVHFPLNKSEDEGRQWYDFLISKGFIPDDTEQACWLYMMGFSSTLPEVVKPIPWLKTVETAQLMIRKVHGNLLATKQLTVARMTELASLCFTKQGKPLRLSKPRKENSQDADKIENFLPTISDL